MRDTDKPRFAEIVNGLAAIKPGKALTDAGLELFWRAMHAWPIEDFASAASQLARTSEFMPNPYHFEQLRKASRITAPEAFVQVMDVVRGCSDYELNALSRSVDPRIDATVRACGGWVAFRMVETQWLGALERRFTEHFETITDAEEVRTALPGITGGPRLLRDATCGPKRLGEMS